jgi:hypothetical protein
VPHESHGYHGKGKSKRVADLLSNPDFFPDEFKTWLTAFIQNNPNIIFPPSALPSTERKHYIGDPGEAPFENGWTNEGGEFDRAHYYRDITGRVWLGGVVQSGSLGAIFTLPLSYRPMLTIVGDSIHINADGTVEWIGGTNLFVPLDGASWRIN